MTTTIGELFQEFLYVGAKQIHQFLQSGGGIPSSHFAKKIFNIQGK